MTTEAYGWVWRKRDYEEERSRRKINMKPTDYHPLRDTIVTNIGSTRTAQKNEDPLSSMDGSDPLSMIARGEEVTGVPAPTFGRKRTESKKFGDVEGYIDQSFEPWQAKRTKILTKYTTSEKISIQACFLDEGDMENVSVKQASTVTTDKVRTRLEQLDDVEEGSVKEMLNLNQAEYVSKIEGLSKTLIEAWKSDQRVKTLKMAIQCAKLLGETAVLLFYPSKFVLITDILDNFGRLVFQRILDKSVTYSAGSNVARPLRADFTPDEVPDSAKETCRNWFYKVASIRELIPRLYVEMAILKCYSFLTAGEYAEALVRLTQQIHGIADPLVAMYARAYLCRVGILVAPTVRDHLTPCWFDFLYTYKQIYEPSVQNVIAAQSISMPAYMQLYSPALDWLLQCIAYKASEDALTDILNKSKSCASALVLNSIMEAFQPEYISKRCLDFTKSIKEVEDSGYPQHLLYKCLGTNVCLEAPAEADRMPLLNEVWKVVAKFKDTQAYMCCAEVWIEYPLKYLSTTEVNTLVGNIVKHLVPEKVFEQHYPQLLSILSKIFSLVKDFNTVVQMDNFLPFMDMFQKESAKVEACQLILHAFVKTGQMLNDPVMINSLMASCKTMHDSVSSISLDHDILLIGNLISSFVQSVSFGRDFEKQLEFYVECRASFSNLQSALIVLVQKVNGLAVRTQQVVKGAHTRKTSAFVRACMAYCFITIPSLSEVFARLKLYLLTGQTALANQAVGQADGLLRAAVQLLQEVPKTMYIDNKSISGEKYLVEYVSQLLSLLLVVPDHPEQGVLYLVRGLLNVLGDYSWDDNSEARSLVYLNAISLLSSACQDSYIYNMQKVDSNDKLYGGSAKFIAEIESSMQLLVNQLLQHIKVLGEKNLRGQANLCASFMNRITCHGDLSSPTMLKLLSNLWKLAKSNHNTDAKLLMRIRRSLESNNKNILQHIS